MGEWRNSFNGVRETISKVGDFYRNLMEKIFVITEDFVLNLNFIIKNPIIN